MNFTNPDTLTGYPSANCAVNGVAYGESIPYQEIVNATQEFQLQWVAVHSFHHHISPCVPAGQPAVTPLFTNSSSSMSVIFVLPLVYSKSIPYQEVVNATQEF